jgi:hypothetical protein
LTTSTLHRHLLNSPSISSANTLSKQFNVPVTTVTRTLRAHGYQFNGETWTTPKQESPLSISQASLDKIVEGLKVSTSEEILERLNEALYKKGHVSAIKLAVALYLKAGNTLPLEL